MAVLFEGVSYYYFLMVSDFSITADLIAAFSLRLIEDDWTGLSSSAALEDHSVPSTGVQNSWESIFFANNINTVLLRRTDKLLSSYLLLFFPLFR